MSKWNVESGTKSQFSERFYKLLREVYDDEKSLSKAIDETIEQLKNETVDGEA